jgi:hypothetical protein
MEGENLKNDQEKDYDPFDALRRLRYDWSNEIPKEILHGDAKGEPPKFKVRRNWWAPVILALEATEENNLLPKDLKKEVKDFREKYGEKIRKNYTTAEDIAEAKTLIDKVLDSQK